MIGVVVEIIGGMEEICEEEKLDDELAVDKDHIKLAELISFPLPSFCPKLLSLAVSILTELVLKDNRSVDDALLDEGDGEKLDEERGEAGMKFNRLREIVGEDI